MIRVLMCGSLATSGGVSTHSKKLVQSLLVLNANVKFFNFTATRWNFSRKSHLISSISKIYMRTIGLCIHCLLQRKNYDIIHIQASGGISSFLSAITGVLISKVVNKKIVITFHYSKTEYFVTKYKLLFRFVLKNADKMIVVSNKQKNIIGHLFPQYLDKIIVLPNGYDSALFFSRDLQECRTLLNLPYSKKIIFNVSNLIDTKGHKYLIEAMGDLVKSRKDVLCIIIGKGYLKENLESLVKELKLDDYVKLLGWRPDEDIPLFINSCDVFVLPSLEEGNPIVMFECLGCGRPFVGTKVGGVPEIIISDDYGFLLEPKNSKDIVEKVELALSKEWNFEKIKKYSENYKWKNIAKSTFMVYSELINE